MPTDELQPGERFRPLPTDRVTDVTNHGGVARVTHEPIPELPMTSDLEWILGRPSAWCESVAEVLRSDGAVIRRDPEAQQAAVLLWLLNFYRRDPEGWRDDAQAAESRIEALRQPAADPVELDGPAVCPACTSAQMHFAEFAEPVRCSVPGCVNYDPSIRQPAGDF